MKKTFLFAAFMAVALAFGFTSCSSSDDDPIDLPKDILPTITDNLLAMVSENLSAEESGVPSKVITLSDVKAPIEKLILSKSMKAILYKNPLTKAINDNVIVCNYEIEGTNIIIKVDGYTIKVSMTDMNNIIIDEQVFAVTTNTLPEPTAVNDINLCREWKDAKYTAAIKFDNLPVWGAKTEEQTEFADVRELNRKVINKIIKDSSLKDEGFNMLRNNLVGVNFVNNGTVFFSYQDGKVEESTWKWVDASKGKLNTTLDGKNVNVDLRFKKGEAGKPNTAYFIIDANLAGVGGLGVHHLTGQLICKMTD